MTRQVKYVRWAGIRVNAVAALLWLMVWTLLPLDLFVQVVRGILVDSAGKPTCHPLEAHLTLHARLRVGACAVDRRGNIQWHPTSPMDKQVHQEALSLNAQGR